MASHNYRSPELHEEQGEIPFSERNIEIRPPQDLFSNPCRIIAAQRGGRKDFRKGRRFPLGVLKKMQPCAWEIPECLFSSKAFTGCFQICLLFQNNLAKDRRSFADKLSRPQMKLQGVFLPELNPQR